MKRYISFTSANKSSTWNMYSQLQQNTKIVEAFYKSELQRIVKDIEDNSLQENEIIEKCQSYSDELKQKLRESRLESANYSLLHLASIYCRSSLCEYMINELKIETNVLCKGNLTPLHSMLRSNVFYKKELASKKYLAFEETFKTLIKNDSDFNVQDETGFSPLHFVATRNNYGGALLLLDLPGIDLEIEDKKGLTALHVACRSGNEEVAELFIDKIDPISLFNILIYDFSNTLPMHMACRHKNEKFSIIRSILEKLKKLDSSFSLYQVIKKEDSSRQTILHLAIENNHLNIVELLLKEYNFNNELNDGNRGVLPIHVAAKNGSLEMLKLLHKYCAVSFKQNFNLENAMHIAASYNRYKFIKEFLIYEKSSLENKDSQIVSNDQMTCICVCDDDHENTIMCLQAKDCKQFSPLMTALAALNQKCVEIFLNSQIDKESLASILNTRDSNGNTIYHICAEFNNIESLKYLFQKYYSNDLVFCKNNADDTILHCALRNGNLEMVKLILNQLCEYNTSTESILFSKNRMGQTCFHIGCIKGYYNICEYFLKEKKLINFVEYLDNNSNSPLHLATQNGHSSIVSLLCEFGAETNLKNDEDITPLEMSCRKGFFEISKTLISNYEPTNNENTDDCPLHTACYEGAHEVVRVLLNKGAVIDKINSSRKNCLDVAISRGHREVIRVLLNDPKWNKLIRLNNIDVEDEDDDDTTMNDNTDTNLIELKSLKDKDKKKEMKIKYIENPQLCALFDMKMWDIFKIILDKCYLQEDEFNFTVIDPPTRSLTKHPLMLIAKSGQENLLRHEVTRVLLHLKWRFIPRFAFYFNLVFYLFFMLLFSIYSIDLSKFGAQNMYENSTRNVSDIYLKKNSLNMSNQSLHNNLRSTPLFYFLISLLTLQIGKEVLQMVFIDGCSYFLSYQNFIEVFTYIASMTSLLSTNYSVQSAYGSLAVLFSFLLFPLYIQKLKIFGLYVVAFRRTLANSAKFFPIFLIMFTGFILSFNIRTHFGVRYFNTTDYSIIRAFTMVVGELETNRMGLLDNNDPMITLPNYIIYFLFIGLMCVIMLNLFVGIAVGEIKTVLDEADIQQTSLRIMFVLKIQSAVNALQQNKLVKKCYASKFLNMNYTKYTYDNENKFIKLISLLQAKSSNLFASNEQQIKLSDPQKRLEESFNEMARFTTEQIKSIKFGFSNQISDVESKLFNSQRRLQDSLIEFSNLTLEQIDELKDNANKLNIKLNTEIKQTKELINGSIADCNKKTSSEFDYTNKFFMTHLAGIEARLLAELQKLTNYINETTNSANFQFESVKECTINNAKHLRSTLLETQDQNDEAFKHLEFIMNENTRQIETKLNLISEKLKDNLTTKLTQVKEMTELRFDTESEKNAQLIASNQRYLETKVATGTDKIESMLIEMANDIKQNSDFEFKSFKVKSNCLEEKMNIIELQLDQVMEVMSKLNVSISALNR